MPSSDDAMLPPVVDALDIGIVVYHPETVTVLDVNKQLSHLYGYSRAEITQMSVDEYTPVSASFSQREHRRRVRAAAAGETQRFERQIERANGELIWVRVHLIPTTIDGEAVVMGEIRDITQYKSRERLLRLLSRIIRHNLRNDMTVLMGRARLVKDQVEDSTLDGHLAQILETATAVGKLSQSVRQIQEIADTETAQRAPTRLCDAVDPIIDDAKLAFPEVGFYTAQSSDIWVGADQGLEYAIDHAVTNAIEHNDHESPVVAVTTELVDGTAEIRIVDNGPPIPEMEIEVLETTCETSSTYHGSGVGLWVMKQCVTAHGGELSFRRRSGRGNVVTFSLPTIVPPRAEEATSGGSEPASRTGQFGG